MRIRNWVAAACVAVVLCVAQALPAQVLKQVPSDAIVVIKVKNLKAVSDKVAALAQKFGLAGFSPEMADPLTALQEKSNMTKGINTAGDLAFAIMAPEGGNEPDLIVLVPVSDYKALIENFADAQTDGEVTTFKMPQDSNQSYAAQWGEYAAISPKKEMLAKKPDGITVDGAAGKELDSKDFVVLGNIKSIRTKVLPLLAQNREKLMSEFEKAMSRMPNANPKLMPAFKAGLNQILNVAQGFLETSDAATFGIDLSEDGIKTTLLAEFQPESYVGQRLKEMSNTSAPPLAGLPEGKYLMYGSASGDPKVTNKVINDFMAPIEKELTAMGDDGKSLINYIDAVKQYGQSYTAMTFGMLAPDGAVGQEPLVRFVGISDGDSKGMLESHKKMFESQAAIQQLIGGGMVQQTNAYTADAKTIEGVKFNQFTTQTTSDPNAPMAPQLNQMMAMLYGPNGMTGFIGAVDAKKTLIVSGASDETIKNVIAAVKANQDKLSAGENVKKVSAQLPAQRSAVMFFAVDEVIATAVNVAQQMHLPVNMQLPADLPPVGMATARDGTAVRADVYIPAELVQSIVAAGMQAFMQMQGGGRPGGAGGL